MRSSSLVVVAGALPAVVAGFFVLSISNVGRNVWLVQAVSVALMLAIAMLLARVRRMSSPQVLGAACIAGIVLCAFPLLGGGSAPTRWLKLGPLALYVAPLVIPAMLVVAAFACRRGGRSEAVALAGLGVLALVLSLQPDLSQVLALSAGAAIIIAYSTARIVRRWLALVPFAIALGWAALQVDPLSPVPHVEQVIRVAWAYSAPAGVAVSVAAIVLVAVVAASLAGIESRMMSVAAYYAVLFGCSIADLTPAPLMGYGAGPLLGYGLMAGVAALLANGPRPAA